MTIQKTFRPSRPVRRACLTILVAMAAGLIGCEGDGESDAAFPVFRDANANAVNDFVEAGAHLVSVEDPRWHEFTDVNGDGICDEAQQADPVWHGPGYVDTDGDGICDYWDADSPRRHSGRRDLVHGTDFAEVPPHTGRDSRQTMMGR